MWHEFQVFVGTVVLKESCDNKLTHNNCIFIFQYTYCTIIIYLNFHHRTSHEGPEREYIYIYIYVALLFDLGAKWWWVIKAMPQRLYPGKDTVPIAKEAGWARGSVWRMLTDRS